MPACRAFRTRSGPLFVAVVVAMTLGGGREAQAAEQIISFDSAVVVRADGVLDVTETIKVRAEGDQIKRGIYRDFPLTFVDESGGRHEVSFRLIGVTRDDKPEPHHTTRNASGVRIYAGDANVFLSPGVYTYAFHYTTGRQLRFLPDHTELFWNVTGNDWAFPILAASGRFTLPDGRQPVQWTAYTGRYGERGQDFTGRVLGINTLTVETNRTLAPGEGLSVAVEIPPGLIPAPSGLTALYYQYLDNRRFVLGGLGFVAVLIFYLSVWNAVGRDPPKGTIIPLFHPPEGISPALAAYIRQYGWRSGWREFTAAAISLAVKGLLVFDDSTDTIVISRTSGGKAAHTSGLPPGERAILTWVDDKGGSVRIDTANGKSIATALQTFKKSVEAENRNRFFRRNLGYFIVGGLLTVGSLALVLIFGNLSEGEIGFLLGVGFASVFLGMFLVPIIRVFAGGRSARSIVMAGLNIAVIVFIVAVFLSIAKDIFQALPDNFANTVFHAFLTNSFPFVLVGGFAGMNGLFYYLLRAPTAAGRKIMDAIEGLELYIRTAETARFNLVGAPNLDATHFERLLPYAIALDAEKPWSDAFATAFARAHPGEDVAYAYAPAWHGGRGWSGASFSSAVSSSVSTATGSFASSVPAPSSSSSGFGGGGGSGGGGGGGGGGGW
jgi:uncharacterized membrane protein YgcG